MKGGLTNKMNVTQSNDIPNSKELEELRMAITELKAENKLLKDMKSLENEGEFRLNLILGIEDLKSALLDIKEAIVKK